MVGKEAQEAFGWKVCDLALGARPDGRAHRQEIALLKGLAELSLAQIVAKGQACEAARFQVLQPLPIEALHIKQHH
jgi:hypothetical protein